MIWILAISLILAAVFFYASPAEGALIVPQKSGQYTFEWASPLDQVQTWANNAAAVASIPAAWILAIMYIESRGNPRASNPHDPSYGLMALELATARQMAGDASITAADLISDPQLNANLGAAYLAWLSDRYQAQGDFSFWADAYNEGPGSFDAGRRSRYGADVLNNQTGEKEFLTPGDLAGLFS